jgi:hypothetical protein
VTALNYDFHRDIGKFFFWVWVAFHGRKAQAQACAVSPGFACDPPKASLPFHLAGKPGWMEW